MKTMISILTILSAVVCLAVFSGCDDDDPAMPVFTTDPAAWTPVSGYSGDRKILMNGRAEGDRYLVAGPSVIALYDLNGPDHTATGGVYSDRSLMARPAIGNGLVGYRGRGDDELSIVSPGDWSCRNLEGSYAAHVTLDAEELSDSYSSDAVLARMQTFNHVGAFNDQDQFLTAFTDEDGDSGQITTLCLIDLNREPIDFWSDDIQCLGFDPVGRIVGDPVEQHSSLNCVASFGSDFLVALYGTGEALTIVESSGEIVHPGGIGGTIREIVEFEGSLYARDSMDKRLYASSDGGRTWTVFADGVPCYPEQEFAVIDGRLCLYAYSQLATLDLETGVIAELDNTGLESLGITSMSEYDGKVWITTYSGLFTKALDDFFTVKTFPNVGDYSLFEEPSPLKIHR